MESEDREEMPWKVSDGVAWIHAHWPAYPMGDTWQAALVDIGSFPEGTAFTPIDYIDRCVLLHVRGLGSYSDEFDERGFHIAVWDESMQELINRNYITLVGADFVTSRRYEERKRDALRESILNEITKTGSETPIEDPLTHLGYLFKGEFRPVELPSLEDYEDDDEEEGLFVSRSWFHYNPSARISITREGLRQLDEFWDRAFKVPTQARNRIIPLIENRMYDTALRELGVLLESSMRRATSSSAYGQSLVDVFISHLLIGQRHDDWSLKVLRKELRTAFKFVRNEFAHNIVDLSRPRARALIGRMCHVLTQVEEVAGSETT
jgi:hypothetical protein